PGARRRGARGRQRGARRRPHRARNLSGRHRYRAAAHGQNAAIAACRKIPKNTPQFINAFVRQTGPAAAPSAPRIERTAIRTFRIMPSSDTVSRADLSTETPQETLQETMQDLSAGRIRRAVRTARQIGVAEIVAR